MIGKPWRSPHRPRQRSAACVRDELVDDLPKFQQWHYVLPTTGTAVLGHPYLALAQRVNSRNPPACWTGNALSELQQESLLARSLFQLTPILRRKLIETVQKAFSWCGYSPLVDAENWMVHRGAAQMILNIFRHSRTPGNYVILSGDAPLVRS